MTLEGTIINGALVLDGGVQSPEGARVRVEGVRNPTSSSPRRSLTTAKKSWQSLRSFSPWRTSGPDVERRAGVS